MSALIAILYPTEFTADKVQDAVDQLAHEGHMDVADSCAVIKDASGRMHLHQENNLSLLGAVSGLALGTFFGWFVWLPYLGIPGAIIGALAGRAGDRGIPDNEMKHLGHEMTAGSSALFLLLRSTSPEEAIHYLAPFGGRIFHTSLSKAEEIMLEEKLSELRNAPPPENRQTVTTPIELHDGP